MWENQIDQHAHRIDFDRALCIMIELSVDGDNYIGRGLMPVVATLRCFRFVILIVDNIYMEITMTVPIELNSNNIVNAYILHPFMLAIRAAFLIHERGEIGGAFRAARPEFQTLVEYWHPRMMNTDCIVGLR